MTATTEETLSVSGILLSKTFGQQANSIEKFRGLNKRLAGLQIRQAMVGRWFFMIIGTIFSIMPAFVYWLAGTLAANGNPDAPTAGAIVAFTTLQSRLFFPLGQLLNVQVEIQGSLALFDRIFEYLEMDPEIVDAPDAVPLDPRHDRAAGCASATSRSTTRPRPCPRSRPTTRSIDQERLAEPEWAPEVELAIEAARPTPRRSRPGPTRRPTPPPWPPRPRPPRSRSASTMSTSPPSPASSSPWSVRPARARPPRPTSSRGCTTSTPARSRSTTSTSARSSSPRSARSSAP